MSDMKTVTFERFIELYVRQKLSLQAIGELYGVSRQRIHQIKKQFETKHGKIQRKPQLDSFTLKRKLEEGRSVQEIASEHQMTSSKVNRLIRQYENAYNAGLSPVKIQRKKARDILPKSLLHQLYIVELKNDKEIAERYHLSPATVWMLRKEYEIPSLHTKSLRQLPKKLPKESFHHYYIDEGYTLQEIAERFNCHLASIQKLKQTYGI